ncbi:MAG: AsmA family protein [Acidobacteriia bacterium]|nr:AsmA family protein [Terriglobia bacterium]
MKRFLKILGIVIGILIVIVIALPFFIDANLFRPRLESELTDALGRQVKVGNLTLSLLSGGVKADDISIADDPAFSRTPFVQAKSLKVGVELIPLIFSKSLHVTDLTLNGPEINLVRSQNGEKWNFSSLGNKKSATPAKAAEPKGTEPASSDSSGGSANLSVAKLNVNDGRLTVSRAGSDEKPRVYDKVNIEVSSFSFDSSFPFQLTSNLPAGGTLKLEGKTGPIAADDAALTPLQAKISIQQMNLATSGFIDPASGISGIADFDGSVTSDGHVAKTTGTLKATKLQVVEKGSPAGKPVQVQYAVAHDLVKGTGTLTQCEVALGKAIARVTGTYDTKGATTSVNMKLNGQGMPVDDLETMLPALGVVLPPGSQLKGGTLTTNLATFGPVNKLVTTGNIRLENSALSGFNLGSKLAAVSALSGKSTGGNDTTIQNFSSDVHVAPDGTRAENINLTIPAFGVLTGAGTVSPSNALDFKMTASLSGGAVTGVTQMVGLGSKGGSIPFFIQGTTSDPKFVPDVKGMAGGLLKNALSGQGNTQGQQNPLSGVMGLFKKKPK